MPCSPEQDLVFPTQPLPSRNLHKPQPHPPEGRQKKQAEPQSERLNKNHITESKSGWKSRELYPAWSDKIKLQKNS